MAKKKDISIPKMGMNRAMSPHMVSESEFLFQLNGNSFDQSGDKYNLTFEHSNILANRFKEGFRFIGGKNHAVRNKTYFFLVNPTTSVSEIGYIENDTSFEFEKDVETPPTDCEDGYNTLPTPLEQQQQTPHQKYTTLLTDECNFCLGFDIDHPIIDILIKEENIGTVMFWTSTPGKKELRYLELDNIGQYLLEGNDSCGQEQEPTCLDCDKLRVFKLYTDLKPKSHDRVLGGNLPKGSYEVLGAYCDDLGNELTSYTTLTPIIPIFDEGNLIHEQEDNNARTNFAIAVTLDKVDNKFENYKISIRYFTAPGVFTAYEVGTYTTNNLTIIVANLGDKIISNQLLALKRPFIESVDGITTANNSLILSGTREREPINLQPVMSLAGLSLEWMSFKAKEDLYENADSYKYVGYNRGENVMFSIDFGLKGGYRTNASVLVPPPPTTEDLQDMPDNDDYRSITDIVGDCDGNIRTKRWQFYNSAKQTGVCTSDVDTVEQLEDITTYTKVRTPSAPNGTITITLEENEEFIDLKQFIESQLGETNCTLPTSPLFSICSFVNKDGLQAYDNVPNTQDDCDSFDLVDENVNIIAVNNESTTFTPKDLEDYATLSPPPYCNIYETGSDGQDKIDEDFSNSYNIIYRNFFVVNPVLIRCVKQRRQDVYNIKCSNSIDLVKVNQDNIQNSNFGSFYHLNKGSENIQGLQTTKQVEVSAIEGTTFTANLHENALWFKTEINDRKRFFIEIPEKTACGGDDCTSDDNRLRISIYDTCSSVNAIFSKIVDLGDHQFLEINVLNNTIDGKFFDFSSLLNDKLYVAVDTAIRVTQGYGEDWEESDFSAPPTNKFTLAPLCGCFNIVDRDEEYSEAIVSYDSIDIEKIQKYESTCRYNVPVLNDCEPVPFKYGKMGHYESIEQYPDNKELYDSSAIVIDKDRITNVEFLTAIESYKSSETFNKIFLSPDADFRCKNIRAYKMPSNEVSPFMRTEAIASNSDTVIYPLGVKISTEVISNLLDVAVDNNLISQEKRDDIVDYKIYRSDATLSRSVVASGMVFNTKEYETNEGEKVNYFNFPYNTLGKDKYFINNDDTAFDKMQIISPEFDYFRPSLPNEMSLEGFIYGKSNSRIVPVDNHSKMVILGKKARSLANTLALLEVIAEGIVNVAQSAEVYRFQAGFSFSANPIGIGLNIAVAGLQLLNSIVFKVGRYRLEWLRSFEGLGTPYNFGYYNTGASNYNFLKTGQQEGDKLRGLSSAKYLKSGFLNVSDTTSGQIIKLNNKDREHAPFAFLGNYPIDNLPQDYLSYDNNSTAPNFSSQVLSSETGCQEGKSPEQTRNVASPYVAFKNYIPNQYGSLNSVKWIDTGYCISMDDRSDCNGILGGDTFITRHTKKRKARIFEQDLLGSADLTPFPYRYNSNYGQARYYVDYKVNSEFESGGELFPDIFYDVKFDCNFNSNKFYVEPPGKFYLYATSFVNFLCETRINTNFRNARKEPWNQFYPQNTDYERITQPDTVAYNREENFFYNSSYLQTDNLNTNFLLPDTYSSENESKKAYSKNSGLYSLPDVSQNSIFEPWLVYRPNDRFTLDSKYGHLTNMKGIESGQILLYFEDALQVQNMLNQFTDGSTEYNSELGDGGMFAKRPYTIRTTDIGYGGSQSKQTLSCEFGHFHADLKRGQVFNYVGGTDVNEISRYSNGKPNNMDVWFKEHLPLKVLKSFPQLDNPDNPYNGIGVHWGYDSKYRRVLLTKKDYLPKQEALEGLTTCNNILYDTNLDNYSQILSEYDSNGFTFEGIEDCSLRFTKKTVPPTTDIYAFFDTTSMQPSDGASAAQALQNWFNGYKQENPDYSGSLYILPYGNESWVDYPNRILSGAISVTTNAVWSPLAILPDNLNTTEWVAPLNVAIIAFVDETHPNYHQARVSDGFMGQPSVTYLQNHADFVSNYPTFEFFRGVIYPIVQSLDFSSGALVLQALAAVEGDILTPLRIAATGTAVDVSILLTENPYSNITPLKELGWKGVYNKVSPASTVFSSNTFSQELNDLLLEGEDEEVFVPLNKVELTDTSYFEDVSWTLTYRPEAQSWESYMSYTPNYYINHTDYFQSGINSNDDRNGLWSHLLSNKSYRVFYGERFPYIFEYPVKNEYFSKKLEDFSWNARVKRFHNEYDHATIETNPFTGLTVYNSYDNSGNIVPIENNGTLSQLSRYPNTTAENTQEVLISYSDYRYNLNYMYNRVKSNTNNYPQWLWDKNQILKTINPNAVAFKGKKVLERLKGDYFVVRLESDIDSNYDMEFMWAEQTINPNI